MLLRSLTVRCDVYFQIVYVQELTGLDVEHEDHRAGLIIEAAPFFAYVLLQYQKLNSMSKLAYIYIIAMKNVSYKQRRSKRKSPPSEARAHPYRSKCPKEIQDRIGRVSTQRMHLVEGQPLCGATGYSFTVLGSTGNLYKVELKQTPSCDCPDFSKRSDLCKHILFILLKAIGMPQDSPLVYQQSYTNSEIKSMIDRMMSRPVWMAVLANDSVRSTGVHLANGGITTSIKGKIDTSYAPRLPVNASVCPICLDPMEELLGKDKVVYCKGSCGQNFHKDCIRKWNEVPPYPNTCPRCQKGWVQDEPYINLGGLQGMSPFRDNSSYKRRKK